MPSPPGLTLFGVGSIPRFSKDGRACTARKVCECLAKNGQPAFPQYAKTGQVLGEYSHRSDDKGDWSMLFDLPYSLKFESTETI